MKKKLLLLGICTTLVFTGCSSRSIRTVTRGLKDAADIVSEISTSEEPLQTIETAPTPSPTPAPKETNLKLGQKGKIGDWKICFKKMDVSKKLTKDIANGYYYYFKPKKGKSFVYYTVSVCNKGKEDAAFIPQYGYKDTMITATLYDKSNNEYMPTQLIGYDKDITNRTIKANKTQKGIIVFEVPKKAAKEKKSMKLKIGTIHDSLIYSAK